MELILRYADGILFCFESVFDFHVFLFCTEDDTDGGIVLRCPFLFVEQVQIEIHFACVFWCEGTDLQVKGYQGLEEAMIEEQVNEVLFSSENDLVLASSYISLTTCERNSTSVWVR